LLAEWLGLLAEWLGLLAEWLGLLAEWLGLLAEEPAVDQWGRLLALPYEDIEISCITIIYLL